MLMLSLLQMELTEAMEPIGPGHRMLAAPESGESMKFCCAFCTLRDKEDQ